MRFLLGVLVGYTVRGKHKLLIKVSCDTAGCMLCVGCRVASNCACGAET